MKKRVFISYSTRTDKPDRPDPDVAATRDLLAARLLAEGYEPLVDRRLRSGELWRYQIYRWIAVCDAAVVLLSRSALSAPWVRKETELLMWRFTLEGQRGPLILPFRLGDVGHGEIVGDEFSTTFIAQLQAPALDDAALADEVIKRLATLTTTTVSCPLRKIEAAIANSLAMLQPHELDHVLDGFGIEAHAFEPIAVDPIVRKRAQVAAALLDQRLPDVRAFLVDSAPSLRGNPAEFLVNWVASFQIDEFHASSMYRRSLAKPRQVAITSQFPLMAQHYVARGYLQPRPPRVLTPVIRVDEEPDVDAAMDSVIAQVESALRESGIVVETRSQLKDYLKRTKVGRFLAFRVVSDDPALRTRLEEEFENVTFIFFTRNQRDHVVPLTEVHTIDVDASRDEAVYSEYLDALEVAR
jgi:hypothetical protein